MRATRIDTMAETRDRHEQELDRIRSVYEKRRRSDDARYDPALPVNRFARRGQKYALLSALHASGLQHLHGKRVLDVGCGTGNWFAWFLDLGITPDRMGGVDLDAERAKSCSARYPQADVRVADAAQLSWPDALFDVVFQSTVLSSILDDDVRLAVAREMRRVLRPGGVVLSYDFFVRRPGNRDVIGIDRRELERLFPEATLRLDRVTLARPLAAVFAPRLWPIARLLEGVSLLNTHYFAAARW